MPVVASAQLVAARIGAEGSASRGAPPESAALDLPSARQALRAIPVAELRFLADRTDGKPLPAGPDPVLAVHDHILTLHQGATRSRLLPASRIVTIEPSTPEARAPPAVC